MNFEQYFGVIPKLTVCIGGGGLATKGKTFMTHSSSSVLSERKFLICGSSGDEEEEG